MVNNNNTMKPYHGTGTLSTPEIKNDVAVRVELMCVKCGKRWETEILLGTHLKNIQCGLCGLTGFVINTGQKL